jgi:hypothetical protein
LRWAAAGFLALYVPSYWLAYGLVNFAFLCNLSVILAVIGIWTCQRVLISSQAVAVLLVGTAWTLDAGSRLLFGSHLFGGTAYMWDPQWPLFTRLLSLYHVVLPVTLVLVLRRIGYDRRGYLLQSAIAIVAVAAGRLFGPVANINYAFVDPILKRAWGGPVIQVAVVSGFMVLVAYPLSHLLLVALCPARAGKPRERAQS